MSVFSVILLLTCFPGSLLHTGVLGSNLMHLGCFKKHGEMTATDTVRVENPAFSDSDFLRDLWFNIPSSGARDDANPQRCILACQTNYFRFAGVTKSSEIGSGLKCVCGSSYGQSGLGQCDNCTHNTEEFCGSESAFSIYETDFRVPSPPQKIVLLQATEDSLHISWTRPKAPNGPLHGYRIYAQPVFSYSKVPFHMQSWEVLDTLQHQQYLIGLLPGSQYNVSVTAVNAEGSSSPVSTTLWTKIGVPDAPPAPKILRQYRRTMTIELEPSRNTQGPITAYQIVLLDDTQTNLPHLVTTVTWNESVSIGYPYYVAAEFPAEALPTKFVLGSGGTYGRYYNGPLPPGHWHPALGVVSSLDGVVKTSQSVPSHEQHRDAHLVEVSSGYGYENVEVIESDSAVVHALWIAIGISAFVLALCTAAYVFLKLKCLPKLRGSSNSRPSSRAENHQLTARESSSSTSQVFSPPDDPTGAYTHMGFTHDEDMKGKCLKILQQVWYVPRNFMDIPGQDEDVVPLIGKGKYGPVYLSSLRTNASPVMLFAVPDTPFKGGDNDDNSWGGLNVENLIKDLEELVRLDAHENVLKLMGFMEDQNTMLFVAEYGGIPLKSLLLQYRQPEEKLSISSYSLLLCAMNIAEGMFHLHSYKLVHGQLAACNILIQDIEKPKITGFGLYSSSPLNEILDFSRWSAVEKFQNRCVKPCDIWSYGVLLWELATLGGTPYHDIRTEDFPRRIALGTRPGQTEAIGDAFYQVMLYCWQLDRDERPDFSRLSCSIHELLPQSKDNLFISQKMNYPPYIHQYEHLKT